MENFCIIFSSVSSYILVSRQTATKNNIMHIYIAHSVVTNFRNELVQVCCFIAVGFHQGINYVLSLYNITLL